MSFFGTWSVYIETTRAAGSRRLPSYSYPSMRRPAITSACELSRYSVITVAIRFFASPRTGHAIAEAALSRSRRFIIVFQYMRKLLTGRHYGNAGVGLIRDPGPLRLDELPQALG